MRVVIALGGNAILRRDEEPLIEVQRRNVRIAARAVAEVAQEHTVVVTHGNGPQVGLLAAWALDTGGTPIHPLDVVGAESMGMIGYLLAQELSNQIPNKQVATLLTRVEVRADDPAFHEPTKPIGPVLTEEEAKELAGRHGWSFAPEGAHYRRVVPSPHPVRILEAQTICKLVDEGVLLVCGGGGGIPVQVGENGSFLGVEAVIDKDRTAGLLAHILGADALLLLTDVPALQAAWGSPDARPIGETTPSELRELDFSAGSMGPKVEAASRFVEGGGRLAGIGALEDAAAILRGEAGTLVRGE